MPLSIFIPFTYIYQKNQTLLSEWWSSFHLPVYSDPSGYRYVPCIVCLWMMFLFCCSSRISQERKFWILSGWGFFIASLLTNCQYVEWRKKEEKLHGRSHPLRPPIYWESNRKKKTLSEGWCMSKQSSNEEERKKENEQNHNDFFSSSSCSSSRLYHPLILLGM